MKRDGLILLLAAYATAWFLVVRLPGDILRSPIAGSDLSSYYTAGYLARTGQAAHLYDVGPGDTILGDATEGPWRAAGDALQVERQHYYIYPPFFALAAAPLSLLSFDAARTVWMLMDLSLLGLFFWIYLTWRSDDGVPAQPLEIGLIAVTLGLEFLPLIWALAIGQTSLLLLALVSGTLLLAKRGNQGAAGLLLGLAAAIKLTPALLVIYFALRGRARLAAWASAFFLLANLGAVAALGAGVNLKFYTEIVPMMSGGTAYFLNQSLAGTLSRIAGGGDVKQVTLEASPVIKWVASLAGILLLGITAWTIRAVSRRWGARRPEGLLLDLEFSCVLLLTLVLSPISWSHYYLLAVVPLYTIVAAAARTGRRSLALAAAAGVAWLLIARKPHVELFAEGYSRIALSAAMFGALMLWVSCLVLIVWRGDPSLPNAGVARAA